MDLAQVEIKLREHGEILKEHSKAIIDTEGRIKTILERLDTVLKRLEAGDKQFEILREMSIRLELLNQNINHTNELSTAVVKNMEEHRIMFEKRIEERQAEQGRRIGDLESAPGKKATAMWDKIITQILMVLISAGVTGALVYLSMK